MEEQAEEERTT